MQRACGLAVGDVGAGVVVEARLEEVHTEARARGVDPLIARSLYRV